MTITRRTRKLPDTKWTPIDRAQNFAAAAISQSRRLALEAAERGDLEADQYWSGASHYADMIHQFIVETALDEDEREAK